VIADVLISGAGPSGAIAALVLARAGVRVLVLDRARFPRDKLCGDTVNPGALAILARLGIAEAASGGLPVEGMVVTSEPSTCCVGRYSGETRGRALRRCALDVALLTAARRAGASVEEGVLVQAPVIDEGRVRGVVVQGPNGERRRLSADVVIAADGASSRIARALGLARHAARPRRWAVGAYFSDVIDLASGRGAFGEMHIRQRRYIGVAPLPGGFSNACVVTADRRALRDPGGLLLDAVRTDPILSARFADARLLSKPICLGPLAVDCDAAGLPGLLLAGDAAGFIDPMTGDGLRFAFRGGELAAEAALDALAHGPSHAHARLQARRRREFSSKWRFNRTLRALVSSPSAIRLAGRGARLSPRLMERAMEHVVCYAGDMAVSAS
jgi:flavin-dependent dehydrogenase